MNPNLRIVKLEKNVYLEALMCYIWSVFFMNCRSDTMTNVLNVTEVPLKICSPPAGFKRPCQGNWQISVNISAVWQRMR